MWFRFLFADKQTSNAAPSVKRNFLSMRVLYNTIDFSCMFPDIFSCEKGCLMSVHIPTHGGSQLSDVYVEDSSK